MKFERSFLYDCRVVHSRSWPKVHRLAYRFFWFALDLDEALEALPRRGLMGTGLGSLYRFCEEDHLRDPAWRGLPLKKRLEACLDRAGIAWDSAIPGARAMLITQLRFLGHVFNPVSFYFCFDPDGRPVASVAEVGNTYGEMKAYALGLSHWDGGRFVLRTAKHFYVSPFTDLVTEFEFRLEPPGERLRCDVDDFRHGRRILAATLAGRRRRLSPLGLLLHTARHPFVTLQIIALIHWNALLLWLKGVPYFSKAANPQDQRDYWERG